MAAPESDPVVEAARAEISAADRAIVEAVNSRVRLVAELKRYKESRGLGFVDPQREREIIEQVRRANPGPLSDDGVERLFTEILALTKAEVARGEASGGSAPVDAPRA